MTQTPGKNVVEVKPDPTIYTVLLFVALLSLVVSIFIVGHRLMASPTNGAGYGLSVGEIFKPWEDIKPRTDSGTYAPGQPSRYRPAR